MTIFSLDAPAKINIHLAIGSRRTDGFHEIESVFAPISLSDTLFFECEPEKRSEEPRSHVSMNILQSAASELDGGLASLDYKDNLVYKAISLFRKKTLWRGNVRVKITKRIPFGAGLGGGSSDAAATLRVLRRLSPCAEIGMLAEELGSDVPFFLYGDAAFVQGRGEIITPLRTAAHHVVIIKPEFSSATASAFRRLDEARAAGILPDRSSMMMESARPEEMLAKTPENWRFFNDFLPLFLHTDNTGAQYAVILAALKKSGAQFSSLSGSGSACFGVFCEEEAAASAYQQLKEQFKFVFKARFCAQFPIVEKKGKTPQNHG